MQVHKAYRFRIYPTDEQRVLLAKVVGLCRLVYNLALEQRRTFGRKGRNVGYHAGANDLPALKAEFPFVKEAPSQCLQQALMDLNKAFENFFAGRAGYPKPRRKFEHDSCRFPQGFTVGRHRLKLPKLGEVRMVAHRKVKGTPKSVTVTREGDHWYASIMCELQIAEPRPRRMKEAGVDLNVATGAVTSDGLILPMPRISPEEMSRRARLHESLAHKRKGSRNRLKAKLARRRRNTAHQISRKLADRHTHLAFENLKIQNMTTSAKGTVEEPGRNVAQKAGLNRACHPRRGSRTDPAPDEGQGRLARRRVRRGARGLHLAVLLGVRQAPEGRRDHETPGAWARFPRPLRVPAVRLRRARGHQRREEHPRAGPPALDGIT
jgi:putative transposase